MTDSAPVVVAAPVAAAATVRSRVVTLVAVVVSTLVPAAVVKAPLLVVVARAQRLRESLNLLLPPPLLLPHQRLLVVKPSLARSARSQPRYAEDSTLLEKLVIGTDLTELIRVYEQAKIAAPAPAKIVNTFSALGVDSDSD